LTAFPPALPVTNPVLIVAIAMILFLVAPLLAERARLPGLIGLIVAGALFGPHGLGILARDATIVLLGTVGLLYLVFTAGLELDLHGFSQYRRRSIVFGLLSFTIPFVLAAAVMPFAGFGVSAALLMGSIVGSHTLLAYPVVSRLGLVRNAAVTMVVGGTLVTDTLALAVLAVVAGSVGGSIDALFLLRLVGGLAIYVTAVAFGVPLLGRWFFRRTPGQPPAEFIFLLAVLFICAYAATLVGAQPIIGAFLAGLTLNRLIPNEGPHMNRIRFVGNAIFIPFFLLSVGMLVDPRVLVGSSRVWILAGLITACVHLGKFAGAWITKRLFRYSAREGLVAFGLSLPQAAATLAVTFVGLEIGLFDDDVVNAVVVMILITGLVGPSVVERAGQALALEEERRPFNPGRMPQRIMVPMANPATAEDLMNLALLIREPGTREAIYPVTVVPAEADRSDEMVALGESMLSHAVIHAAAADVPVIPVTRMDHNFANGIARAAAETRSSTLIIGWDGRHTHRRGVFGTVLDQLLELTRQQVIVAKLGHPLNTTRRIVLVVPRGSDHLPGFLDAAQTVNRMASQLGARIEGFVVGSAAEPYLARFGEVAPKVPTEFARVTTWNAMLDRLGTEVRADDLVVVISARRGAVSWISTLERLPGALARLLPESFIMLYPSDASVGGAPAGEGRDAGLPAALDPARVLFGVPAQEHDELLLSLLATAFGREPERQAEVHRAVLESEGLSWELVPGVVVPHARIKGIGTALLFLAIAPEGVPFPGIDEPARLVFLLLVPRERPEEHLSALADIARLVGDPQRLQTIAAAGNLEELLAASERA
jgi:Kef-type K+ transport system membrane component KefB/mannitol/fructose-specific phosphotransferase system IIA component (Ntr-type)